MLLAPGGANVKKKNNSKSSSRGAKQQKKTKIFIYTSFIRGTSNQYSNNQPPWLS